MEDITARFQALAKTWKEESAPFSSLSAMTALPSHQEIVSMGWEVVSLILADLQKEPSHWFMALSEITGENPIPVEHQGRVALMAEDWLDWGRQKGLV